MSQDNVSLDISGNPTLVQLAEEVRASGVSVLLQIGSEDVALVTPAQTPKKNRGRPLTDEDALFELVGIGSSGIPGGISEHKHEALNIIYRYTDKDFSFADAISFAVMERLRMTRPSASIGTLRSMAFTCLSLEPGNAWST